MIEIRRSVATAGTAMVLLAGCANSVDGTASAPTTSSAPPSSPSSGTGFPTTLAALGELLRRGNSAITSAHITLDFVVGSTSITAVGDEQLSDGRATALRLVEQIPSFGSLELRIIGTDEVYVKQPAAHRTTRKPWVVVNAATTDPSLRQIYQSLQNSSSLGSLESVTAFVHASRDLQFAGPDEIDGATVGHYLVTVDTTALPADFPNKAAIVGSGVTEIPVELYVDEQGRTRKGVEKVTTAGNTTTITFTLGDFDAPVSITAPPPAQVSTR